MSISGGNITETTISGLTPSTTYSIEVATVNSAGIGAYSSSISSFISGDDQYILGIFNCIFNYKLHLRSIFIGHHISNCYRSQ